MSATSGSRFLWLGLLAPPFLVLIGAGVMTLWPQHLVGAIDAVARAWSPAAAPRRPHHPGPMMPPPGPPPEVRGTIRKPDGTPYDGPFRLLVSPGMRRFLRRQSQPQELRGPDFVAQQYAGRSWVVIDADDYAAAVVGPTDDLGEKIRAEGCTVDLRTGFEHRVRVVDADGAPISGAAVRPSLTLDNRPVPVGSTRLTDEGGWAVFPHMAELDYEFEVGLYDFSVADDTIFTRVAPGVDTQVTLDRRSSRGVVVDEAGAPAADALILVAAEYDGKVDRDASNPFRRVVIARSDSQGRFPLPHLHRDSTYLLRAEGRDGSLGHAPDVKLGGPEPAITLHPRRMVRGRIKGDRRYVSASIDRPLPGEAASERAGAGGLEVRRDTFPLTVDAEGRFEYPTWTPGDSELKVAGQTIVIPWPPPADPIVVDASLEPPIERTVQLRLMRAHGIGPIRGVMTVFLMNGPAERSLQDIPRRVEIHDDQADVLCLSTDKFRYESNAIPGYWTMPGVVESLGGVGDRFLNVSVYGSGTIRGRVVDPDGNPAGPGAKATASWENPWGPMDPRQSPMAPSPGWAQEPAAGLPTFDPVATDSEGRFAFPSLPVGISPVVSIERGRFRTELKAVAVSPQSETREILFHVPRTAKAEIRLLDEQRRPIPGVTARVTLQHRSQPRWNWPAGPSDADGRIVLEDLAEGVSGYGVEVDFPKGYRRLAAPLEPGGPPLELIAEPGEVVEGRVVESVTGWPLPGIVVTAHDRSGQAFEAEAASDDQGRFRISTLPKGAVKLSVGEEVVWKFSPSITPSEVQAGAGPVTLRLSNLREEAPRPRPPARP